VWPWPHQNFQFLISIYTYFWYLLWNIYV
jgi:hypothetical protein